MKSNFFAGPVCKLFSAIQSFLKDQLIVLF